MAARQAGDELSVELPFTNQAPSTARSHLQRFAADLTAITIDDALVMLSELVTNAVQHGRPEVTLHLWLSPGRFAAAVSDRGDAFVRRISPPQPSSSELRGRGLVIVNALADHWGVRSNGDRVGKTVWFDLAAS